MESEVCGCNYTIIVGGTGLPSPGPELGTLDAEGDSDSDVGKKILIIYIKNISFQYAIR